MNQTPLIHLCIWYHHGCVTICCGCNRLVICPPCQL
jgi:hypothetical protein